MKSLCKTCLYHIARTGFDAGTGGLYNFDDCECCNPNIDHQEWEKMCEDYIESAKSYFERTKQNRNEAKI